jgi:hypothetical protein
VRGAVDPLGESGNDHDVRRGARTCDLARHALAVSGHPSRADDGDGPRGESRLVAVDPERVRWTREVSQTRRIARVRRRELDHA